MEKGFAALRSFRGACLQEWLRSSLGICISRGTVMWWVSFCLHSAHKIVLTSRQLWDLLWLNEGCDSWVLLSLQKPAYRCGRGQVFDSHGRVVPHMVRDWCGWTQLKQVLDRVLKSNAVQYRPVLVSQAWDMNYPALQTSKRKAASVELLNILWKRFLLWELLLAKALSVGIWELDHGEESIGECGQQFVPPTFAHLPWQFVSMWWCFKEDWDEASRTGWTPGLLLEVHGLSLLCRNG